MLREGIVKLCARIETFEDGMVDTPDHPAYPLLFCYEMLGTFLHLEARGEENEIFACFAKCGARRDGDGRYGVEDLFYLNILALDLREDMIRGFVQADNPLWRILGSIAQPHPMLMFACAHYCRQHEAANAAIDRREIHPENHNARQVGTMGFIPAAHPVPRGLSPP